MRPCKPDAVPALGVSPVNSDDYRDLVDSVTDYAIFLLDAQGRVLSWNPGAERIEGYAAREVLGQHLSKFYTPEDVARGKPAHLLARASADGHVEDVGLSVCKGGKQFWASSVITALRGANGQLRGFGSVVRDLTELRSSEEDLLRAEQRFHQLVDAVTDYSIFMLDPTGHVATWNAGARTTKGYEAAEIIGQHFSVFYTAADRAAGRPEQILNVVRSKGRFAEEGWRVRKDGTLFWASVVLTTLRNERGEAVGFAKITRDLTERRAAERELRDSEERFRLLVEAVGDYAIYMISPEGEVRTWNLGAERMKGYTASEIIGQNFQLFFPEEDVRRGKPARELAVAASEGRLEDEGWRVRKDGSSFWANVVLTAIRGDRGQLLGFAKVTRDLSARRQAEEMERELMREQSARAIAEALALEAEEANRIKDEFLATVSHELRTPLNAIVGWSSILRQRELEASVKRGIEVIERNAHAQVKIIEDILDVSRIITGKLRVDPKPMDLVSVIRQAIEVVRHSASAKQISIELQPTPACPLVGDAERIQQVVWNLLSNAIKFTSAGGRVTISVQKQDDALVLSVADTGMGMADDFLPFAFERFRQGDSSTTRRFGGLGLGLALVRHISELHGGSVSATSAGLGKGSTFRVTLPLHAVAPSSDEVAQGGEPAARRQRLGLLSGLRLLLVEDDTDARELLRAILLDAGAEVECVSSADAALISLRSFRPQLLLSDIAMPGEDGYSLIRRIRALDAAEGGGIPSIALTASTREEDRLKALQAGFTSHIGKPVNPTELVAALASLATRSP